LRHDARHISHAENDADRPVRRSRRDRPGGVALLVAGGVDGIALEGAVMLVGAGLSAYLLNWLYRIGVSGDQERAREDAARRHFDRHGSWPE